MEYISIFILGAVCCVLGIINATGNLSTIKYRQRRRVEPENRKAFGLIVGIGTIIMGVAFLITGVLLVIAEKSAAPSLETAGGIVTIVSTVIGLAMHFFAMIKYNKGIF